MKKLLLVRHGKSSKDDPDLKDFDRPLAERGERDAPEMGRRIARRGPHPDYLLTSAAKRAAQTAKLIARELDFPWKEIREERRLYDCGGDKLLALIQGIDAGFEVALVVGHNPDMTEVAQALVSGEFREDLPTCAVLALEFPADTWAAVRPGKGRVIYYDTPKK